MKKMLLTLAALVVIAAPSFAYVQSGNLPSMPAGSLPVADNGGIGMENVGIGALTPPGSTPIEPLGDQPPTRPVPEPATMVLASMGLLALGAAGRKRRSRS